ncbi:MAG: hypothetical protein ACFN0J_04770 [Segatella salivae]
MFFNRLNSIERGFGLAQIDNRKFVVPLVAALPAIVSAAGAVTSAVMNKNSNDNNNQLQQQLVQQANAYNTPSAQVGRFRQAGLNPYMMLGQVNSGNQQSVASTQPTDYSGVVNGAAGVANTLIQAASANSQIKVNDANVVKTESETALNRIDAQTRAAENLARINQLVKQGDLTKQQADNLSQEFDLRLQTWDALLKSPALANVLTAEQIDNLKSATAKLGSEKKGIDLQNAITGKYGMSQAAANVANTYSQTGVNNANVGLMGSQIGLNGTYMDLNRGQLGVVRNQQNSAYWDSKEKKRNYQYNKVKFNTPRADWWSEHFVSPLLNLVGKAGSAYLLKK